MCGRSENRTNRVPIMNSVPGGKILFYGEKKNQTHRYSSDKYMTNLFTQVSKCKTDVTLLIFPEVHHLQELTERNMYLSRELYKVTFDFFPS